jgi:hypothetical protein
MTEVPFFWKKVEINSHNINITLLFQFCKSKKHEKGKIFPSPRPNRPPGKGRAAEWGLSETVRVGPR